MGRRVGAFLIDLFAQLLFNGIVFAALADKKPEGFENNENFFAQVTFGDDVYAVTGGKAALYYLIIFSFGLLWWVVLPGIKGWTVGKRIVGIRVVDEQGQCPAGIGRNLVRQLLWIVDSFPYVIPYLTGFIVAVGSKDHRRVGDMVAGTYVVDERCVDQPPVPPVAPRVFPAGWHPDPQGEKRLRYWDGTRWTDQTAD
jgi:uncharacterized RDD family membrane protein YckC